jgi:hypothetical protein
MVEKNACIGGCGYCCCVVSVFGIIVLVRVTRPRNGVSNPRSTSSSVCVSQALLGVLFQGNDPYIGGAHFTHERGGLENETRVGVHV